MNIITLKEQIKNKTFKETLTILKCSDVTFIASQYIKEISESQNRPIIYIESLSEITDNMFDEDLSLYVMRVDKLEEILEDTSSVMKIVVCKSIDKAIEKEMKSFIVDIPKLLPWQTKALLEKELSGLTEKEIDWLNDTIKDIYRLDNELSKISIFSKKEQPQIFRLLNEEDNYKDFNSNTVFNFTNAIVKRDTQTIRHILENIDSMDVEPMGVLSILYKSFKNVIDIQLTANATPESTGMSPKQFNAVRYSVGKYNSKNLIRIFDIITSIDSKLKMGLLPHENIIDYLLINILT